MKEAIRLICGLFMVILLDSRTVQGQVLFKIGDVVSLAGQQLTLDRFYNREGIWESTNGKYYIIESAKRQGKDNYILTEIELSKDSSSIINWKSAFEIGPKLPFSLDNNNELKQVDLIQRIDEGKVLKRSYETSISGRPMQVTGLVYYRKGDTANFVGKQLVLDRFINDKALWKDQNNRLYEVAIIKNENGKFRYALVED